MTSSLQSVKQRSYPQQTPQQPILKTKKRKRLFWGILSISLILHGVFLILPWPHKSLSTSTTQLSDEANDTALEEVPLAAMPAVSLDELSQSSTSREIASERTVTQQQSPVTAPRTAPTAPPPPIQQPVQSAQPQIQPPPVQLPAQQQISEPAVQPESQPAATHEEAITPSHASDRVSLAVDPMQSMVMLLGEDFPDLAGAKSGCYGLSGCRQLSGNYRQAATQLLAQLKAQGYTVKEIDDIDDPGHRVFEAIAPDKPNDIYYLNVYSPDAGSTVYVMAVEVLSLAELAALSS